MSKLTPENRAIYWQEFIGMDAKISSSGHPGYLGIHGRVVNETRNTLQLITDSGVKTIPKAGNVFQLNGMRIDGRRIMFRPEDRIKKIR